MGALLAHCAEIWRMLWQGEAAYLWGLWWETLLATQLGWPRECLQRAGSVNGQRVLLNMEVTTV